MASRAVFLARLLAGEMPHEIEDAFATTGLSLFPATADDLDSDCSCPDWENPCKHVAAVCYLLAEAFDRDPFLIFAWRGRPRERLLAELRALRGVNDGTPVPGAIDEPDGICVQVLNMEGGASCANGHDDDCDTQYDCDDPDCAGAAGCPGGCDPSERLCWGGVDDDCDGDADGADSECAMDPSCRRGPCPPGQTPTYRQRDLGSSYGASGITRGDGGPNMPMSCEMGTCPEGEVAVVLVGQPRTCVPPPPECPAGTSPNYVASGRWRCDGPCDLIIHYGSIYGGRNVCAPNTPMTPCPSGQSWTFREESETWECRATCDNSLYDRITIGGGVVCVPC